MKVSSGIRTYQDCQDHMGTFSVVTFKKSIDTNDILQKSHKGGDFFFKI